MLANCCIFGVLESVSGLSYGLIPSQSSGGRMVLTGRPINFNFSQDGWTKYLSTCMGTHIRGSPNGPHGSPCNFGNYGSVVLSGTRSGIANQIPM